jgi:hypothetical protein
MAQKWLPASSLIGGAEGALDTIDGSNVSDGDHAIVIADLVYFYVLDADSGLSESSPQVISPDSNAGDKRWVLVSVAPKNLMLATNADGSHEANVVSSAGLNDLILAGEGNKINVVSGAEMNAILSGWRNLIEGESHKCTLTGDENEISNGAYDIVLGGYSNYIGSHSPWNALANIIAGGIENKICLGWENWDGTGNAILGGEENKIVDSYGNIVLGGYLNRTYTSRYSVVSGSHGISVYPVQSVIGGGNYYNDIPGKIQASKLVLGAETTGGIETALEFQIDWFDDIVLKTQKMFGIKISISAMQVAGSSGTVGDAAFWNITGGFKNIGGVDAVGTITFTGATDSDLPLEGEIFVVGNYTTYRWTASPAVYDLRDVYDVEIGSSISGCRNNLRDVLLKNPYFSDVSVITNTIVLTALPNLGEYPNTYWVFTESSSNMEMDGSGYFGGTTPGGDGNVSLIGTPQGTGTPGANDHDAAIAAQGIITMSGLPVADETFVVDTQTFTWKASRSTTGEVTIGADAAECVTNIVTAVGLDLTTVTAEDGAGDTVVLTAATAGSAGNSIVLTESATNMAVDGSGSLGATTEGDDKASLWEVDVEADNTDKALKINVTGEADKTIHWTAKVELVEVG